MVRLVLVIAFAAGVSAVFSDADEAVLVAGMVAGGVLLAAVLGVTVYWAAQDTRKRKPRARSPRE